MQKFYSIVLMAVALLLGTNVKAETRTAGTPDALVKAFEDAQDGDVIQLTANITIPGYDGTGSYQISSGTNKGTYLYYYNMPFITIDGKKLTLNLNGKTIQDEPTQYRKTIFYLKEGELNIVGTGEIRCNNKEKGVAAKDPDGGYPVYVSGNGDHRATGAIHGSKLTVGAGVTLFGNAAGVYIDGVTNTHTLNGAYVNGMSGTQQQIVDEKRTTATKAATAITGADGKAAAFHAYVDVLAGAKVQGRKYGAQISGNVQSVPAEGERDYLPTIYIHEGAEAFTLDGKELYSVGAYSAGYGHFIIEGNVHGASGVYAKGGNVEIKGNATISSDATSYNAAVGQKSGVGASGSAIIMDSNKAYAGAMEITVSGDATITGNGGYAVESTITTATNNQVEGISLQGGNFNSGTQGGFDIAPVIADNDAKIKIDGVTADNADDIAVILAATNENHVVSQIEDEKGNIIVVVVESDATVKPNLDLNNLTTADTHIELTASTQKLSKDVKIDYLALKKNSDGDPSVVTIPAGKKLEVGTIVIDAASSIVVEPGAKLVVTAKDGIVAHNASNLVIKTQEGNPAYFLLSPAVAANRHPMATVEFISKSYRKSATDRANQRFGIPTYGALTSISAKYNNVDVPTAFFYFDYTLSLPDWVNIGYINNTTGSPVDLSKMANAFDYYQMQHNTPEMGTVVTMTGALVGNQIPAINVRENFWNGYANSMLGDMDITTMLDMIPNTVDKAIYLYDITASQATWEPKTYLDVDGEVLGAMQSFLIRNTLAAATVDIDYEEAVYNPSLGIAKSSIAARRNANTITKAKLIVKGENCIDRIVVAEDAQFSAEFDNGYDAAKYMNDGINMYVTADEKMSNYATNNLDNTYVGFQTVKGGKYTIEFDKVNGNDLTLIDLATGARIAMVEGNVYEFTADANTTNDYRFQIVGTHNAPTSVENVSAANNGAVYTIMGQYVGEMSDWDILPAGIYVVDGVKRVK
jgi:hypothetical protein